MSTWKNSLVIVLITLYCTSCNSNNGSSEKISNNTAISAQPENNAQAPAPDIEAAETVVAVYYSDLNRKAGYPLYKGLELKILKVYQDSNGQQMIDSDITGRKRNSIVTDTSTLPFREQISLRAKWLNKQWQPDTAIAIIR